MPKITTDYCLIYETMDGLIVGQYFITTSSPITKKLLLSLQLQIASEKMLPSVIITNCIELENEVDDNA